MVPISPAVLDQLKSFDTPTLCNTIELFDVRPRSSGYMDGRIRACFREMGPIVGFASTATFRSAAPAAGGAAVPVPRRVSYERGEDAFLVGADHEDLGVRNRLADRVGPPIHLLRWQVRRAKGLGQAVHENDLRRGKGLTEDAQDRLWHVPTGIGDVAQMRKPFGIETLLQQQRRHRRHDLCRARALLAAMRP